MLIVIYIVADIFVVNAFLMQRAVLDVGQKYCNGTDMREYVMPKWYKYIRIPQIITWVTLAYMLYLYPWYYAVGIFIIDYIFTSICPIPKSKQKWAMLRMYGMIENNPETLAYAAKLFKKR
jgi:hypothetical protein